MLKPDNQGGKIPKNQQSGFPPKLLIVLEVSVTKKSVCF